jgi:predicted transposase/invertase (TIGR01784 family)
LTDKTKPQSKVVYAKREGRQQEKLAIARKMKKRGIAAEQIAEDTGLDLKQVKEL